MIHTCTPEKIRIYHNTAGKLPEEIKRETGCTTIFNGVWFNGDGSLCCDNRIDGKTVSDDQYAYYGFGWSGTDTPVLISSEQMESFDNFISCLCASNGGVSQTLDDDDEYVGGVRARMACGIKADKTLAVLAETGLTLTQARDKLKALGCADILILDGGGSVYLNCPSGTVETTSARKKANRTYICVWENVPEEKFKVCLDPGHGREEPNCSPDKRYYEYQFAWDMANRIKTMLEQTERFDVMLTKTDEQETPGLSIRAVKANAFGADVYVSIHSNAVSDGWNDSIYGLSVWIYEQGGRRERLAKLLLEQFDAQNVELFGAQLYTAKFTVLAKTNMPAVLIENLFHTCRSDVDKLLDDDYRDKLACATACGICKYFNLADDVIPLTEDETVKEEEVQSDIFYRVQTGAFDDENNAKAMAETLEKAGYNTIIKEVKKS